MFASQIAPKQRKTASVIETTQKQFVRQVQSIQVLEVSTSSFLWFCIVISSRSPATLISVRQSLISVVSVEWQSTDVPGHYGGHPRPQVADRGTPSIMDKRVAPD